MAGLLIDTDIPIDYLRGEEKAAAFLENQDGLLWVSSISVAELYSGVRGVLETAALEELLQEFQVIPVDRVIAKRGGLFCRDFRGSHGVGLADAMIAATAEVHQFNFATLNRKHYPMLQRVAVPYRKV